LLGRAILLCIRRAILGRLIFAIKQRPWNLVLIFIVICLYLINNLYLKMNTTGLVQRFFVCYFNDLICPLLFMSYSNLLLFTVNRELSRFLWIMLVGLLSGVVWELCGQIFKPSAVADIYDLVCYIIGAFLYWLINRINRGKTNG
jgi:hypothetical protein